MCVSTFYDSRDGCADPSSHLALEAELLRHPEPSCVSPFRRPPPFTYCHPPSLTSPLLYTNPFFSPLTSYRRFRRSLRPPSPARQCDEILGHPERVERSFGSESSDGNRNRRSQDQLHARRGLCGYGEEHDGVLGSRNLFGPSSFPYSLPSFELTSMTDAADLFNQAHRETTGHYSSDGTLQRGEYHERGGVFGS